MISIPKTADCRSQVLAYFNIYKIPPGSSLLIGLSGGPDSTALLELCVDIQEQFPLALACACFDHGLRPESTVELGFVQKICSDLNVQVLTGRAENLREQARESGRSLEEIAREHRYRFLEASAKKMNCDYIAVGHTADDHLETLIMRFFEGAFAGLAGIPARRGNILRPLINCSRQELLTYLHSRKRGYQTDSSNLQPIHLRNAVRLKLLPVVKDIFPGYGGALAKMSRQAQRINSYLEEQAGEQLVWERTQSGYRILVADFLDAPAILRTVSLFKLLNQLNPKLTRLPHRFLSPLYADHSIRTRTVLLSGYGFQLRRQGRFLFLIRDIVCANKKGYLIDVARNRRFIMEDMGLVFEFSQGIRSGKSQITIDCQRASGPLVMRSERAGDRLEVKGGTKKVRQLLSEWYIPQPDRWRIPILEDREGIVAILGEPLGFPNRFRENHPKEKPVRMRIGIRQLEDT